MKRYYVFIFGTYYPNGGAEDFAKSFEVIEDAKSFCMNSVENGNDNIFDIVTEKIVCKYSDGKEEPDIFDSYKIDNEHYN